MARPANGVSPRVLDASARRVYVAIIGNAVSYRQDTGARRYLEEAIRRSERPNTGSARVYGVRASLTS